MTNYKSSPKQTTYEHFIMWATKEYFKVNVSTMAAFLLFLVLYIPARVKNHNYYRESR